MVFGEAIDDKARACAIADRVGGYGFIEIDGTQARSEGRHLVKLPVPRDARIKHPARRVERAIEEGGIDGVVRAAIEQACIQEHALGDFARCIGAREPAVSCQIRVLIGRIGHSIEMERETDKPLSLTR